MPAKTPLNIAVIGAGNIAQQHLKVLVDLPEANIVALADQNPETRDTSADRFGIKTRRSTHQEILEKDRPDAVFVLVSVLAVADVAADVIKAGIPTFLEKPPGLYTAQTKMLADLARKHNVTAMVGVNRRFYSTQLEARSRLMDAGGVHSITVEAHEDITRIREGTKFPLEVLKRWSAANGIHALDLLRYFGGDVSKITAIQHTIEGPMPDCCSAVLKFENGAIGRALMDWFAPGGHRYEIRGQGITLTSAQGFATVTVRQKGGTTQTLELTDIDRQYKAGFHAQDQTFLRNVIQGTKPAFPACSLDDAAKTMAMIDAISGTGS